MWRALLLWLLFGRGGGDDVDDGDQALISRLWLGQQRQQRRLVAEEMMAMADRASEREKEVGALGDQ